MAVNDVATLGIKVDPRGAITGASKAKRAILRIGKAAKEVKNNIFSLQGAFVTMGAGATLRSIITTASEVENLKIRLKFLTGSADDAGKAFEVMNKFASRVPFALEDIEKASAPLLTVADNVDELNELLEITGDIAAVSGLSFSETAMQIQRAMGAGIASADQFREKGISAFLGFESGVSYSAERTAKKIKAMWRDGTTTAKGATAALKNTFTGQVSMMQDAWRELKLAVADAGVFRIVKELVTDITETLKDPAVKQSIKNLGVEIKESFQWLIDNKELLLTLLGAKATMSLAPKNPVAQITAGLTGAAAVQKQFHDAEQETLETSRAMNQSYVQRRRLLEQDVKKAEELRESLTGDNIRKHWEENQKIQDETLRKSDWEVYKKQVANAAQELARARKELAAFMAGHNELKETAVGFKVVSDPAAAIRAEQKAVPTEPGVDDFGDIKENVYETTQQTRDLYKAQQRVIAQWNDKPAIKYGKEIETLNKLIDAGAITWDQYSHAVFEAEDALEAALEEGVESAEVVKTKWQEAAEAMKDSMADAITDMTMGLNSFKDTIKSVGNMIARLIIKQKIAEPIAAGISGSIGNINFFKSAPTAHTGGMVGTEIKKFHSGGIAGDEVPAILQKGEMVLTKEQQKAVGNQVVNVTYAPQVNALDPRTAATVIAQNAPTIVGVIRQAFNRNGTQVAI